MKIIEKIYNKLTRKDTRSLFSFSSFVKFLPAPWKHLTVRPKGTFAAKIDFHSKNWRFFFFQSLLMKFCFLNPNLLLNCGKAYANPPNLVVIIARSLQLIKPLISYWILGILSWNFDWMVTSLWQTKIINWKNILKLTLRGLRASPVSVCKRQPWFFKNLIWNFWYLLYSREFRAEILTGDISMANKKHQLEK